MSATRQPNYTPEVEAAMRAQGLLAPEPEPEQIPEGLLRYHVAIEGVTTQTGITNPAMLAATLRGLAAQLDPQKENTHA